VEFFENKDSQVKQVVPSDVGDGYFSQVIKAMGIGHILPIETHEVVDQANDECVSICAERLNNIVPTGPPGFDSGCETHTHSGWPVCVLNQTRCADFSTCLVRRTFSKWICF
jgi:hypothetical protein